jgi:peptidylprolyl isomerase/peptidyl-prolyl cis-trans isomerase D
LLQDFTKFLYDNNEGTVGVTESAFGTRDNELMKLALLVNYQTATVAKKVVSSKATSKALYTDSKIQQQLEKVTLDALAKEYRLKTMPVRNLQALDENLPGISRNRGIVQRTDNDREVGDNRTF